jgi:hypothetical protein
VNITINPAPVSDVVNTATADFSTARGSIVGGSYADTQEPGGGAEILREQTVGGNPRKARSDLDHTWTFTVAPGVNYLFQAVGSRTANTEGDNFALSYSLDNSSFTTMATINSAIPDMYEYAFPQDVAGTVYVRIEDTDNSQGNSQLDEVAIDWMAIVSLAGSGGNSAPVVSITAPTSGATVTEGASVSFAGSATDGADGNLAGSLAWASNIDGNIGAGSSFSTSSLSVGMHLVVAMVTDSGGLTGSATVSITIEPVGGTSISLSASGYKDKGVQYVDLSWSGNAGAVDVYRNGAIVASNIGGSMTDNTGNKGSGQVYQYEVCETGATTSCSNTAVVGF